MPVLYFVCPLGGDFVLGNFIGLFAASIELNEVVVWGVLNTATVI